MSRNSNKDLYFRFRERWNRLVNGSGNQSVLVAVSGGLDSMVCLHLFTRLRDETGLTIYAAHVNHGLRPEAKEDEALVQSVCARNGIPLDTRRIAEAPTPGESLEDWARNQRYALLELAAAGFQAQYIVTAHHANDQAETVLWRLQNGAGPGGLAGIYRRRGRLLRPLLDFTRQELEAYQRKYRLEYREDATNRDDTIPRNFLRNRVVAPWEKTFPELPKKLVEVGDWMKARDEAFDYMVEQYVLPSVARRQGASWILAGHRFDNLPEVIRLRLLQILDGSRKTWRRKDWHNFLTTLSSRRTGLLQQLPGGSYLLRNRNDWIVRVTPLHPRVEIPVRPGERIDLPTGVFIWNPTTTPPELSPYPEREMIDEDKLKAFPSLVLRPWKPGDWIQPLGMQGRKKVSDFLIDQKLDRLSKEELFVLAHEQEVLWICGHRISEKIKLTPETRNVAELSFQGLVSS